MQALVPVPNLWYKQKLSGILHAVATFLFCCCCCLAIWWKLFQQHCHHFVSVLLLPIYTAALVCLLTGDCCCHCCHCGHCGHCCLLLPFYLLFYAHKNCHHLLCTFCCQIWHQHHCLLFVVAACWFFKNLMCNCCPGSLHCQYWLPLHCCKSLLSWPLYKCDIQNITHALVASTTAIAAACCCQQLSVAFSIDWLLLLLMAQPLKCFANANDSIDVFFCLLMLWPLPTGWWFCINFFSSDFCWSCHWLACCIVTAVFSTTSHHCLLCYCNQPYISGCCWLKMLVTITAYLITAFCCGGCYHCLLYWCLLPRYYYSACCCHCHQLNVAKKLFAIVVPAMGCCTVANIATIPLPPASW